MPEVALKPDRADAPPSLVDDAYALLEQQLVTGKLEPLRMVTEAALSRQFGIGRTPIREALQRLEREGLVRIIPYRGIQVTPIDAASQMDWIEVRSELEKLIARAAARRASADERRRMLELAQGITQAAQDDEHDRFMRIDRELHELLIRSTRNPALADVMQVKQALNRRFWYVHGRHVIDLPMCARLHADLLQQVAVGDEAAAEVAVEALLDDLRRVTREVVLAQSPGPFETTPTTE